MLIPLVGYLIYSRSKKKTLSLALWCIPVLLIPFIWPAHSLFLGEFHEWIDGITHQATERNANHGIYYAFNQFYMIDPLLLILGLGSIGFVALRRRDILPLLWAGPIILFFYLIHYASVFYFILIVPVLCIASAIMIDDLSERFIRLVYKQKDMLEYF